MTDWKMQPWILEYRKYVTGNLLEIEAFKKYITTIMNMRYESLEKADLMSYARINILERMYESGQLKTCLKCSTCRFYTSEVGITSSQCAQGIEIEGKGPNKNFGCTDWQPKDTQQGDDK